jgi:glycosyltransferase involved in cell wall biosynthesis
MSSWTGIGRYTTGLARALARRDDVELVQLIRLGESPPVDDARFAAVKGNPLLPPSALRFSAVAKSIEPDVVHCMSYPTPLPAPNPLVATLHDIGPLRVHGVMPSAAKRLVYEAWNRRAARVADRIITPSDFSARELEAGLGISQDKIRVVYPAADDFLVTATEVLTPEILGWTGDAPLILSMGNTKAHRNLPVLLRAFQSIIQRDVSENPPRLVLVGGAVEGYLEEHVPDSAVRDRIRFSGRISDGQLRTLYELASMFVFPSYYEGFGLPPLEAMALGTPVITTKSASLPEVVGDAALRFSAEDSSELEELILEVLENPVRAKELSLLGHARAAAFSWDETARGTVEVYRELLVG